MSGVMFINNAVNYIALAGQEEWTYNTGTFTWIVPRGVYEIHACVIGGGGGGGAHATSMACGGNGGSLAWGNKIPVTPGEQITIVVGSGGGNALASATSGGNGGESYIARGATRLISAAGGQGGATGASASTSSSTPLYSGTSSVYGLTDASYSYGGTSYVTTAAASERCSGGGGAAGYYSIALMGDMSGGVGGPNTGGTSAPTPSGEPNSGGGGGGTGGISNTTAGAGGGTGPWGRGSGGVATATGGWCGSGGSDGLPTTSFMSPQALCLPSAWSAAGLSANAGLFGGGGAGGLASNPGTGSGFGARGCVRIMWGEGRGYPATNTGNYYGSTAVASSQQNYLTPGTYTWNVPAGVTEFSICAIGGGGSGMQGSSTSGKGSGGGGGLCWANFNCKPSEQFTVVVGAGGQSLALNAATAGGASTLVRNANFFGYISGTNLYVTRTNLGTITIGMALTGSGVTACTITGFQTGEYGNEGTYTVSVSQTVGSLFALTNFAGTLTLVTAGGGGAAPSGAGGTFSAHSSAKSSGGASGGAGGAGSTSTTAFGGSGGGAGGYQGTAGGAGRNAGAAANGNYPTPYTANRYSMTGGSSSGRNGGTALTMGAGGGGTGIYGTGKDANMDTGQVSSALNAQGIGGSGGTDGAAPGGTGQGGTYGGGGGGAGNNYTAGRSNGGPGGVRITWGARHKYPAPTTDV